MPSLVKWYFLVKGGLSGEPRLARPFHERVFAGLDGWLLGKLPGGKLHLAICLPPRHSKTTLARDTVECSLGLWPDSDFIYVSYSAQLAVDQTVKIRRSLESGWFREIFPAFPPAGGRRDWICLGEDSPAGGHVLGVGVGGSLTGFGAGRKRDWFGGGIVIDDPLKADAARSAAARRRLREWFTGTLLSRRNHDRTPILLIAQRLHPEDLAGHLKLAMPEQWHFLEIPVLAPEAADTIWPETFSLESARRLREADPFAFYSQYQQEPIRPGGSLIKEDWWRFWSDPGPVERAVEAKIITADTAYGAGEAGDYSVFQCWGFEGGRRMYLLDQIRGRWGFEELVPAAAAFWEKHNRPGRPLARMYIENRASGQSLVQQYQLFRERGINAFPWNALDYGPADKVGRVKESVLAIYNGQVILPDHPEAAWVDDFIAECSAFSEDLSQAHDDQVDALTMAVLIWRGVLGGGKEGKVNGGDKDPSKK
ncbi:MAG: phage terminase large subunit [Planctomycetota bacterium]|jgi:predicted phage terminase large subunit-like protein|nr:phage terminase large subunit [Planctomycetota bacterium]